MAALVLVALVPAVGVLWFMTVAMRNERLAVQERLTAVYANHLASLQRSVTAKLAIGLKAEDERARRSRGQSGGGVRVSPGPCAG